MIGLVGAQKAKMTELYYIQQNKALFSKKLARIQNIPVLGGKAVKVHGKSAAGQAHIPSIDA